MKADSSFWLLLGVCLLSILLLSAVESGKIAGVNDAGPPSLLGLHPSNSTLERATVATATAMGTSTVSQTTLGTNVTSSSTPQSPNSQDIGVLSSTWLVAILAATILAIGVLYLRLPSRPKNVVDLEGEFYEMRLQQTTLEKTTDYKVRNAALVRYFELVRKVCTRVGLVDASSETPHEYIGRLSSRLSVDQGDAQRFATVIDEAMYGVELPPERTQGLSKFMGAFTENVRRLTLAK